MTEKRLIAGQAVGMALALGVGILIGARACGDAAPAETEPVDEPELAVREPVVCDCPTLRADAGAPDAPDAGVVTAAPERPSSADTAKNVLPEAPEPTSPAERRQLLQWVRNRSSDLKGCSGADPKTIRTTVTLRLDDDGEVARVVLVDSGNEISSTTETCLRTKMSEWKPPPELVERRRELIFGLTL